MALFTGQVIIGTTPTQINTLVSKDYVSITNVSDKEIFLSADPLVSVTTGDYLPGIPGSSVMYITPFPIYGVVASGTATIAWAEERS